MASGSATYNLYIKKKSLPQNKIVYNKCCKNWKRFGEIPVDKQHLDKIKRILHVILLLRNSSQSIPVVIMPNFSNSEKNIKTHISSPLFMRGYENAKFDPQKKVSVQYIGLVLDKNRVVEILSLLQIVWSYWIQLAVGIRFMRISPVTEI